MYNDVFVGINEKGIEDISIELLNYSDRIAEILEKIDDYFHEIGDVYKSSTYNNFMLKYETFKKNNFKTIKSNVASYSVDYLTLSRILRDGTKQIALKIVDDSTSLNQTKA